MRAAATFAVLAALWLPAAAQTPLQRPDCLASTDTGARDRCVRETRKAWREANFAALQKTGLIFDYMARPEVDAHPAAKAVLEAGTEGEFRIQFSVSAEGGTFDVRIIEMSSGIEPVAQMWAQTISRWTFGKTAAPVRDIEYRRIYLKSSEDRKAVAGHNVE